MQRLLLAMLHMSVDDDSDDEKPPQRPSGATPRAMSGKVACMLNNFVTITTFMIILNLCIHMVI